ncbi:MAG: hypothetical protein QNJ45_24095 [Ardenticatenaceae bacterium]|nr:hypothetical protein [Ardenticatenaceae bacterium]
MHGIFVLDYQRPAPPLDQQPLAFCWIANGPVLHQLVNGWGNQLTSADLWVPHQLTSEFQRWLEAFPLTQRFSISGYDPAAGFPADQLVKGKYPKGVIVLASDASVVIPAKRFDGRLESNCVAFGRSAVGFASPRELYKRLPETPLSWERWVDEIQPDQEQSAEKIFPLLDNTGSNEALLMASRRLLSIGYSSSDALERSYTEEFAVIPPVYIDPEAEIYTSVIGPYAAVGPGALVENAVIRQSVIAGGSQVSEILLEDSYIAANSRLSGQFNQLQTPLNNSSAVISKHQSSGEDGDE